MANTKPIIKQAKFMELADSQWEIIKNLVDYQRSRKHDLRIIFNAILWVARTGAQWRNLDSKFPPWGTVYYYFQKYRNDGTWQSIVFFLVNIERVRQGKNPQPSVIAVDSQSVKVSSFVSKEVGIDGGKKINGRKRHIGVDSLGLPVAFHVTAANVHDGQGGIDLLWQLEKFSNRIKKILGDSHYTGYFLECASLYNWEVENGKKPESKKGFVPQSGRWQVERTFAWFINFRRLAKDYEKLPVSAAAFMMIATISIILTRLS